MKIVGKTDGGYLCQITEEEIGVITGFGRYPQFGDEERKKGFAKATGRSEMRNLDIPTNAEIQITAGIDFIEGIRSRLITSKKAAASLRELADMIENPIPTILAPSE
jgi:hypothetical protein